MIGGADAMSASRWYAVVGVGWKYPILREVSLGDLDSSKSASRRALRRIEVEVSGADRLHKRRVRVCTGDKH